MPKFADSTGQVWDVKLTVGLLGELRREAKIDLSKAMRTNEGLTQFLFSEPESLVMALWVICAGQAKNLGVTPEEFGYRFDGRVLELATEAMLESIADFFPRQQVAMKLKANLKTELARMDQAIIDQMDSTSKNIAGNSPALPASTPEN